MEQKRSASRAALVLVVVLTAGVLGSPGSRDVSVQVEVSRVERRVDERFLSLALDASLVDQEKFMSLLGSPKLRTLAAALTPAFLRFGGTKQDFMTFTPQRQKNSEKPEDGRSSHRQSGRCGGSELPPWLEDELKRVWAVQAAFLRDEEKRGKPSRVRFSEDAVDQLHLFADCSGLDLIFGLNALLRTSDNVWNSTNAELLLEYCQSQHYNMSWELGNEPNSYEKKAGIEVGGSQLGRDFLHFRKILQDFREYRSARVYGPDIGQPRGHRKDLLTGFLESAGGAIDACTWHHYYVNGRDATLDDFLDPDVLDSLEEEITEVLKVVGAVSPGMRVWLGETSSAYGGGAVGLSDTFVAGFMWLDKLGLAARLGLDVVVRQVLLGAGTYHLVDDNLDPLPDYWLSLIYKRLVGPEVLKVRVSQNSRQRTFRVYMHCTHRNSGSYRAGAVTLFALNVGETQIAVALPVRFANSSVEAFVLQAAEPGYDGLRSRAATLNGELLKVLDDGSLPELRGVEVLAAERLRLPAHSFAFYVVRGAGAPVC